MFEQLSLFDRNERTVAVIDNIRARFGLEMVSLTTRGAAGRTPEKRSAARRTVWLGVVPARDERAGAGPSQRPLDLRRRGARMPGALKKSRNDPART